ncbi:MAG TPA: hypothetical protein DCS33_02600, partial [Gammaproteobacteria bacterium]|nr:hypothetical protein [Gammaproteobacteria bacterium]
MSWPTTITMPPHILRTLALLTLPGLLLSCSPESEPAAPLEPETTAVAMQTAEPARPPSDEGEWGAYAANNGNTKYTDLDQIDASNVASLEIAWRRPALDSYYSAMNPSQRYTSNWISAPVVKNGIAYVPNGVGLVEAFNPGTGETIWVQEPVNGAEGLPGANTRGVAYWSEGDDRRILVQRGTFLYALNADTGQAVSGFGVDGRVDLDLMPEGSELFRWGGVPMVVRDVVVIGQSMSDTFSNKEAFRGDVHAFDVRTGELRWTYNTIPQEGQFGTASWQDRSWSYTGHSPVWALFSAD